jgi:hypothetical protein
MVAALENERKRLASAVYFVRRGYAKERASVASVLRTSSIISGKDLERDEMACARDGCVEAGKDLEYLCL